MRDPLVVLARLRRLEVAQARKQLAERNHALATAEARHEQTKQALAAEAASAPPADFAAWMPLAFAERDRAARAERQTAGMAEMAREALTLTRVAERQVELLQEEQAKAAALKAQRKAQAKLDEVGGRR